MVSAGDVSAAEQAAKEALDTSTERLFPLVERAVTLRIDWLQSAPADERSRVFLRGVRSSLIRFLAEDQTAAMDRHPWYRRQVQRRTCPGYRLEDEGVWAIVPESDQRWECYLQLVRPAVGADDTQAAQYTLHSRFGTRYGELVFQSFHHFVDEFSGPADLDAWVEVNAQQDDEYEGSDHAEEEVGEGDAEEEEEADAEEDSVAEMLLWVAWRRQLQRTRQRLKSVRKSNEESDDSGE